MRIEYWLRVSDENLRGINGVQWPRLGPISAGWIGNEWTETLDGFPRGEGSVEMMLPWNETDVWQVFACDADQFHGASGRLWVPRAWVVFSGTRAEATGFIRDLYPDANILGTVVMIGDHKRMAAGDGSRVTAGDNSQVMAGIRAEVTVGYRGVAHVGDLGRATAGDYGMASAGYHGRASAGDNGQATAGIGGLVQVGKFGEARAGTNGTARAGFLGRAAAGMNGRAAAGHYGTIAIEYDADRPRLLIGYIGEGGLLPDTLYRVVDHRFVPAGPLDGAPIDTV